MDNAFFFEDPDVIPLPPEAVKFVSLEAEQYPEGERLRVMIETTPFQQRPWIEVALLDSDGEEVASANIIEPLKWKIIFTMHLRRENPSGEYKMLARLYYPEKEDNDRREIKVQVRTPG